MGKGGEGERERGGGEGGREGEMESWRDREREGKRETHTETEREGERRREKERLLTDRPYVCIFFFFDSNLMNKQPDVFMSHLLHLGVVNNVRILASVRL